MKIVNCKRSKVISDKVLDFYFKRAKAFLDYYGDVNKNSITEFLGITENEYYRIIKSVRK